MIVAIHQPQYLPWVPYFDKADCCDVFVYLDNVQFQKNGLQNRNQIKTATGAAWLTIPVHAKLNRSIAETQIADSRWHKKHALSIELSYARASYSDWFQTQLRAILMREWPILADLNIAVTECFLECLGIRCKRVRASALKVGGKADDLVLNICSALGARAYLSGQGARGYQDENKFKKRRIELLYQNYQNQEYQQCHPEIGFTRDLSALDLVLNVGPRARDIMVAGRNPPIPNSFS